MAKSVLNIDILDLADKKRIDLLAFKNHRWTNLIRTGKAIETMNVFGETMKVKYPWILSDAFNVNENRLVYAFPLSSFS